MTDPQRADPSATAADVPERDRDARTEELLVQGLDHYFSEQYDLAINVWTRVLFLDRGHARARAYIERARSALAERQRRGDELLHTGAAALGRGDAHEARVLVTAAVEQGAARDEALALLARIERLEVAAASGQPSVATPRPPVPAVPGARVDRRSRVKWIAAGAIGGALLAAAGLGVLVERGVIAWPIGFRGETSASVPLALALPVPSSAEIALSRAEALQARGRLRDAMAALDAIPYGDPLRPRADALKTAIQRDLLAAGRAQAPKREGAERRP
jgi:hypothetical protein